MLLLGVLDFLFPGSCPITRPVDCEWEPWYKIPCESCSKSCGEGTRRCKRVKRTTEKHGGKCHGSYFKTESCRGTMCRGIFNCPFKTLAIIG